MQTYGTDGVSLPFPTTHTQWNVSLITKSSTFFPSPC